MRDFARVGCRAVVTLSVVLLAAAGAYAQFNLGTITGRITDPAGAVTPECAIQIQNVNTGAIRTTVANGEGIYTVAALPAGQYRVSASMHGFKQENATVEVGVNQTLTVDFKLSLGAVTDTVTVDASSGAVALQQEDHSISQLLESKEISSLPVEGRNFLALATLVPGVQPASILGGLNGGSGGYFETLGNDLVVAGQAPGGTSYLQDGVPNINLLTQSANILPDMDAMQEVSIETNGMSAKFDRPAIVNVSTKSGSNRFHGSLYDFLQNDAMDANNWIADYAGIPLGPHRYNQFGGTIGGPILKDKLFFFFNYEGQRQLDSAPDVERVPTDAERGGDFSAWLNGITTGVGQTQTVTIYDPSTYNPATGTIQAFPGNIIPSNRISDFAKQWLQFYPEPNDCPSSPCNTILPNGSNYATSLHNTSNLDQYLGRMDYNISQKDRLFGYYQTANAPVVDPSFVPNLFGTVLTRKGTNIAIEETHVFSPSLLNTFRVGYNRTIYANTQLGVGVKDWTSEFGIQNLDPAPNQWSPPGVSIAGVGGLGSIFAPQGDVQNRFQYADEVNYTRGNHHIDAGVEVIRTQFDGNWVLANTGSFDFSGQFTSNHSAANFVYGLGMADLLLGLPDSALGGNGNTTAPFRKWDAVGYAQDDWRLRPNLVLNLGVRYLYDGAPIDISGHAAVFDLATNTANKGSWDANPRDFAPRLGFAWTLTKKTVLRGGYGFYYYQPAYNMLQFLMANPPNFLSVSDSFPYTQPTPISTLFPTFQPGSTIFAPFAVNQHMPTPYTEQYNLNIQREITKNMLLTIGYVGNQGHDQSIRFNPNQASLPTDPSNPSPIQSRRPFPDIGDVTAQYNVGYSNYNSLQAKLQKTFSDGFSFLASYTYSRAFDLIDSDSLQLGYDAGNLWRLNYGPAGWDQPQNFTVSYVYELPFGHGKRFLTSANRLEDGFLGGWQLNGITSYESGLPFGVQGADNSDTGSHWQWADASCSGVIPAGQRTYTHMFNTSCFSNPGPGTFGNAPRNLLRSGGFHTWDFSLFKNFRVNEAMSLQFRAEAFNIFNEHTFEINSYVNVNDSNFGSAGFASPARTMQLGLKLLF